MSQESSVIKQEIKKEAEKSTGRLSKPFLQVEKVDPAKNRKVGRNDPCTCDSGEEVQKVLR